MILAGDIGGTNARLAFYEPRNGDLRQVSEKIFPSRNYKNLGEIVVEFLNGSGECPEIACFGIAGPVRNGRVDVSNLPWVIEAPQLAQQIGVASVLLINDLEANAWGIGGLNEDDLPALNQVAPSVGNQAVIAPGTGLGEAGLFWDGGRHHVFASEGGHCDFAPQGGVQIELLQFLAARYGHVSYERVLSGPGLVNVYEFQRSQGGEEPAGFAAEPGKGDAAAKISNAAMDGTNPLAEKALDLWISVYGAEAGNLALKTMATGGIFLSGGISPKILSRLSKPAFMNAFLDKGRLRPLLEGISVKVVTNDQVGLLGAARCAAAKGGALFAGAS
jgi:glucokinase